MFFKKRAAAPAQINTGMLFLELATQLYKGLGRADGTSLLSATLEFDKQQRVINIKNLLIDGVLRMPPLGTVTAMNDVAEPMTGLPANQKLKALAIRIEGGRISTDAEYLL